MVGHLALGWVGSCTISLELPGLARIPGTPSSEPVLRGIGLPFSSVLVCLFKNTLGKADSLSLHQEVCRREWLEIAQVVWVGSKGPSFNTHLTSVKSVWKTGFVTWVPRIAFRTVLALHTRCSLIPDMLEAVGAWKIHLHLRWSSSWLTFCWSLCLISFFSSHSTPIKLDLWRTVPEIR